MGTHVSTAALDISTKSTPPASASTPKAGSRSADRSLIARQGALTLHSRYDSREITKSAREKFLGRFIDEVDPNRELPEHERLRRAESLKKAYFTGLARKSAAARRKASS
jgi:hypothetical protein